MYDSFESKSGFIQPADQRQYKKVTTYYFNRHGFMDSIIIEGNSRDMFVSKVVYDYSKGYHNFSYIAYYNGAIDRRAQKIWLDSFKCQIKSVDISEKQQVVEISEFDRNYRDKSGSFRMNYNGNSYSDYSYVNFFGKDKVLDYSEFHDKIKDSSYTIKYQIREFDHMGNSINIAELSLPENKVHTIYMRKFEYYLQ